MEWKYEAIDKLKKYEAKKSSLQSIPREIRTLDMQMQNIRSAAADGTPAQGGSGREDMLLSCIVKKEELRNSLEMAKDWVKRVETGLSVLSEEERLILDRFYMNPDRGNVDRLCGELSVEKATVYRYREKALRHFTLAVYGCTEI